jgi:hypothetical protein
MAVNNYSMTSQLTMEAVHTDVIGDVRLKYRKVANAFRCLEEFGILALREHEPQFLFLLSFNLCNVLIYR